MFFGFQASPVLSFPQTINHGLRFSNAPVPAIDPDPIELAFMARVHIGHGNPKGQAVRLDEDGPGFPRQHGGAPAFLDIGRQRIGDAGVQADFVADPERFQANWHHGGKS